jgi:hypothetical protein
VKTAQTSSAGRAVIVGTVMRNWYDMNTCIQLYLWSWLSWLYGIGNLFLLSASVLKPRKWFSAKLLNTVWFQVA